MKQALYKIISMTMVLCFVFGFAATAFAQSDNELDIIKEYVTNNDLIFDKFDLPNQVLMDQPGYKKTWVDMMFAWYGGVGGALDDFWYRVVKGDASYNNKVEIYERVFEAVLFEASDDKKALLASAEKLGEISGTLKDAASGSEAMVEIVDHLVTIHGVSDAGARTIKNISIETYDEMMKSIDIDKKGFERAKIVLGLLSGTLNSFIGNVALIEDLEEALVRNTTDMESEIRKAADHVKKRYGDDYLVFATQHLLEVIVDKIESEGADLILGLLDRPMGAGYANIFVLANQIIVTTADIFQFERRVNDYVDAAFLEVVRWYLSNDYQMFAMKIKSGNYTDEDLIAVKNSYYLNKYATLASYEATKNLVDSSYGANNEKMANKIIGQTIASIKDFENVPERIEYKLLANANNSYEAAPQETVVVPEIVCPEGYAAVPTSITATSHFENSQKYAPGMIADGDVNTAWSEGVKGGGSHESVTFMFEPAATVHTIYIVGGYAKSNDLYIKNGRVARVSVELQLINGSTQLFDAELEDVQEYQAIDLGSNVPINSAKLTIGSVYPGTVFEDTCISEVCFLGIDPEKRDYDIDDVKITDIDKVGEVVTIENISDGVINLNGWILISQKGGQKFTFSDCYIDAGSSVTVGNDSSGAQVTWGPDKYFNNMAPDNVILEDHKGNTTELTDNVYYRSGDVKIIGLDKVAEVVTIKNSGNAEVSLDGWELISEKAGQTYTFGDYRLGAGSSVTVGYNSSSAKIKWGADKYFSNMYQDNAILKDHNGERFKFTDNEYYRSGDVKIIALNKIAEVVTIKNTGNSEVSLENWVLISEKAGQTYTFGDYRLGAGSSVTVGYNSSSAKIKWGADKYFSNMYQDNAILKDHKGERFKFTDNEYYRSGDVKIIALNKVAEVVTIKNTGNSEVSLEDWVLISEKGGQTYTFGDYRLNPGKTVTVGYNSSSAKIKWGPDKYFNNMYQDNAILKDHNGKQNKYTDSEYYRSGDVKIIGLDKVAEVVTIKNSGNAEVSLIGWVLISEHGGQSYTFGDYRLCAGCTVTVGYDGSNAIIKWGPDKYFYNAGKDDAILKDNNGRTVSEFVDTNY